MHSKIRRSKPCLLMFASLVALDDFHLQLSSQLTIDLIPEWNGGSMFHPLSHIYAKIFFASLKKLQTTPWIADVLFLIDCEQTQYPLWTLLSHWQIFMQNGKYTAFWYFYLLCYLTQIQFTIDKNEFVDFLSFPGQLLNLGDLSVEYYLHLYDRISSQHTTFPTGQSPNNTYQVIALLEQYFFHRKSMLYQNAKFRFSYCFEILQ